MLVATADMDRAVQKVIVLASSRMAMAWTTPPVPTTKPALMKRITPRMVRMLGVKTPPKVPRRAAPEGSGWRLI